MDTESFAMDSESVLKIFVPTPFIHMMKFSDIHENKIMKNPFDDHFMKYHS